MLHTAAAADKADIHVRQDEVHLKTTFYPVQRRNWTPTALGLPFLVSVIVFLQICTAGLELLVRQTTLFPPQSTASVQKRQDESAGATTDCTTTISVTAYYTLIAQTQTIWNDTTTVASTQYTTEYSNVTEYASTQYTTVTTNFKRAVAEQLPSSITPDVRSASIDSEITTATPDVRPILTQRQGSSDGNCVTVYQTVTITVVDVSSSYGILTNVVPELVTTIVPRVVTTVVPVVVTAIAPASPPTPSPSPSPALEPDPTTPTRPQASDNPDSATSTNPSSDTKSVSASTPSRSQQSSSTLSPASFTPHVGTIPSDSGSHTPAGGSPTALTTATTSTLPTHQSQSYYSESSDSVPIIVSVQSTDESTVSGTSPTTLVTTDNFSSTSGSPTSSVTVSDLSEAGLVSSISDSETVLPIVIPTSESNSITTSPTLTASKITTSATGMSDPSSMSNLRTTNDVDLTSARLTTLFASITMTLNSTVSAQPTRAPPPGFAKHDLEVKGDFQPVWYFAAMYLPVMIAVVIKELWSLVGASIKLMQPFYRLSRSTGATFAESLCSEYLSSTMSWSSLKDAFTGNFTLLLVILLNVVVGLLAPFATESMTIVFTVFGRAPDGSHVWGNPAWLVSSSLVRALQALISFISVCLLVIISLRRRTGISANPSSIASIATLLNSSDMVREIAELDPNTELDTIMERFKYRRYALAEHIDRYGQHHYGFLNINSNSYGVPETQRMLQEQQHRQQVSQEHHLPVAFSVHRSVRLTRSILQRAIDFLLPILIVSLFSIVIAYRFDTSNSSFEAFFTLASFGPRFILTILATLITIGVQNIEHEVRVKTPYRNLAMRHARVERSILRTIDGTAVTNLFSGLFYREWFNFFVGIAAVLGDILIIAVAGVPFSSAQIWSAFLASFYVSVGICGLMLLVVAWGFIWRAQNKKLLIPEEPNNVIIRVMMSLSGPGNKTRIMFDRLQDIEDRALRKYCQWSDHEFYAAWNVDDEGRLVWSVERETESLLGKVHQP